MSDGSDAQQPPTGRAGPASSSAAWLIPLRVVSLPATARRNRNILNRAGDSDSPSTSASSSGVVGSSLGRRLVG